MTIRLGHEAVRERIASARLLIAGTTEPQWTPERRASWSEALDAIEAYLDGNADERGFSIVRSLDTTAGTDGPTSDAILAVAGELRRGGIERYC